MEVPRCSFMLLIAGCAFAFDPVELALASPEVVV